MLDPAMFWCLKVILVTTWMILHQLTAHAQERGDCDAHITGQSSGFVHSPNYPEQYDNNLFCTWIIEVNAGEGVKMTPVTFSLEEDYDWLDVYMGDIDNVTMLGSYTGQNIAEELFVTYKMAHLVLSTDRSNTDDGFKIHFEAFDLTGFPCPDPGVPDNGYRTGDDFAVGSVVSFGCNDGYVLFGQERLTCMSGDMRYWNFSPPDCKADCDVHINGQSSGFIHSPNYPEQYDNNFYCRWIIEVNTGEGVKMTPVTFSLEEDYDWLDVYMGDIDDATLLGSYTGQNIPEEVIVTYKIAQLVFSTDESNTDDGFNIHFEAFDLMDSQCPDPGVPDNGYRTGDDFAVGSVVSFGCNDGYVLFGQERLTCMSGDTRDWDFSPPTCEDDCGGHITGQSSGLVRSPKSSIYPELYDNNLHCRWIIEVNTGEGVKVTPVTFSLEEDYDWLHVYMGELDDATLLESYTGQNIPGEVVVPYKMAHLVLTTDEYYTDAGRGFKIYFEDSACAEGRDIYEKAGEIASPHDVRTGKYQDNVDCSWILVADPGKVVVTNFSQFDIEFESRCRYDYLRIQDMPYMSFNQTFCGSSLPPVYVSMASELRIHFHSDEHTSGTGFKLRYYLQDKSEDDLQGFQRIHHLSGDTGTFSSMNYPHYPYRNHVYQQWNIIVDTRKAVKLIFTDFDVDFDPECSKDYVLAEDPFDQIHYTWCGTCVPPPRTSAAHIFYVMLVTDFVIRRTGFSARYEAVDKGRGPPTPDIPASTSDWLLVSDKIKQISVSSSTNQVWALDDVGRPLRRTGITKMAPQGTGWEVVGTERFLQISVGHVGVWAVYNHNTVVYRVGTYGNSKTAGSHWQAVHIGLVTNFLFNFEKTPRGYDWIHEIDQIHSGKNVLWVIGTQDSYIYGDTIVRKGISSETPGGKRWETTRAVNMKEISVSSRTGQLWAVERGFRVLRSPFYCEVTVKYDWESIDGCKRSISVGRAGVWAVDSSGEVYHRAGTFLNETSRGDGWVRVPGVALQQVDVGDGIVWGVDFNNRVFAKLLPAPTDRATCQVGLKGHSACYAIQKGFAACPEKRRRMCNGDVGCYSPIRVCDGERNCGADTEDERDCLDSCIFHAKRDEFLTRELVQCRDLKGCVKITKVCDGKKDCSDGSDEIRCDEFCSLHGLFGDKAFWKCRDSPGCVKGEFLCDGIPDCEDGSDEDNCDEVCESIGYWPCRSSLPPFPKCISRQERCDRHANCRDFSDEMDCGYCGHDGMTEFESAPTTGIYDNIQHIGCIPMDLICDGKWDSGDYREETDCTQGLARPCDGRWEWKCPGENTCLPDMFVCNTVLECSNGEDEKHCDAYCDSIDGWRCQCDQLTQCYLPSEICDGEMTCFLYTTRPLQTYEEQACYDDEANCEEYCDSTGRFHCPFTNKCINHDRVCDGIPDCIRHQVEGAYSVPHDEASCADCTGVWAALRASVTQYLAKLVSLSRFEPYPYAKEDGVLHDYLCSTGECSSSFFFCDDSTLFGCSNWEDEQGCEAVRCPGRTCEATHKCGGPLWIDCDGLPDCLDFTDETNCASTKCVDTQITSSDFKRISISQYCDGNDDCRTGIDENPRKCAMFTDRLPCISSNRFISRSSICDGIPDCVDASDEDACIGKGACLLPLSLLLEEYSVEEGTGTSHVIRSSHGLTPAIWEVEGLNDWLQISLEDTVQLTGIVISGSRPSQTLTFSLEYGVWTDCLTAYTEFEGDGVKIFQARTDGVEQAEHYLAVPVQARVVRLTPQSLMDTTILEVGLLGCLIKEHPEKGISCGKGWTMFEERCYQKFSSPLVWWAAERYCQALGGHLVAVNSLQENEFLRDNVGNGWIGMKLAASLIKEDRQNIVNFTWSDGSPAGEAFQEQGISFDVFQEYIWRLNDPFCAFLEKHGPWSLQPCSLIEKEYICEKDPSSYRSDGCDTTANYNYTDLQHVGETDRNELNMYLPDMTVCDDCMASKPACGNIRCGSPDQYRCGLIYSPGYPIAFPSSVICLWIIDGPPGSFVTLLLLDVDLPGYSSGACTSRVLQIRDRFLTVDWNTIHGLCRGEGEQRHYVSSSNDMQLAMLATSNDADFGDSRGFMATFNIRTFSASRQVQNLADDAGFICPCGWHLFRRNCFQTFRHTSPVTWEESDAKCRESGANLTSVADRAEMEFLHLLLVTNVVVKRIADPMLFIGLYDIYRDRTFVWTDGTPVTYMDWSPMDIRTGFPQPDGAKINFCVAIVMKNVWGTDQWYDVACDDRATRSYICKQAAKRVTGSGNNT
ncbi:uncharacterized protein LOC144926975 isoform X3 [Branchiostoma floridae x Branchiostoma belcheri]